MNLRCLTSALMGILLGSVCLLFADLVDAQPQQAYRYNLIQKFIVANKFIFGADINKSFLYAYEPSDVNLQVLCQNSQEDKTACEWLILRPAPSRGWWAETPYEIIPYQGNIPGQYSAVAPRPEHGQHKVKDGDLLAVGRQFGGARFHDLFVIDNPVAGDTSSVRE